MPQAHQFQKKVADGQLRRALLSPDRSNSCDVEARIEQQTVSSEAAVMSSRSRRWQERQAFEAVFEQCKTPLDKLSAWCDYVKWAQKQGSSMLHVVLERASETLGADDLPYRHDERYVQIMLKQALQQPNPPKHIEALVLQGIGMRTAMMYLVWATAVEKQRRFNDAAAIYERAYQCGYTSEMLAKGHVEFKERMASRARRDQRKKADASRSSVNSSETVSTVQGSSAFTFAADVSRQETGGGQDSDSVVDNNGDHTPQAQEDTNAADVVEEPPAKKRRLLDRLWPFSTFKAHVTEAQTKSLQEIAGCTPRG